MSLELIDILLSRLDIEQDPDTLEDGRLEFQYQDRSCAFESSDDSVILSIDDDRMQSNDAEELVDFFQTNIGIPEDKERLIDELVEELRVEFKK